MNLHHRLYEFQKGRRQEKRKVGGWGGLHCMIDFVTIKKHLNVCSGTSMKIVGHK